MGESTITRRKFVKGTAISAGAIMTGALPASASAFVQGSDTLKLAVVGCGGRGTGAANQALQADKNVELVAMADAFMDQVDKSLEDLSKVYGKDRIKVTDETKFAGFDAYRHAIDQADVVILATTPGFRPIHFKYAVDQDKHIFMEKPLATDAYGIRSVLETAKLAKEKKLNVVVGLQRHYQNSYNAVVKMIHGGDIGQIVSGQVYWDGSGVWVRERQPDQTEMEYQMRNWYYFNWLCGDHIVEQHIHNLDVANWFIGEYPATAQGMGGREVRKGKDNGQIFDHHFVEFTYPGGAVIASQSRHQKDCFNRIAEAFQGTKGTIYTSGNVGKMMDYTGSTIYMHDGEDDPNPYQTEHDKLFASIRKGEVINNAEYGAKSTMTAIMGRMATYSGKMLTWEEALNSSIRIVPDESDLGWDKNPPVMPDTNGKYPIPVPGQSVVV